MEKGSVRFSNAGLFGLTVLLLCLLSAPGSDCFGIGDNPSPTVIVIDDETGKPIDGAVALAVWRRHSSTARAWWEGGTDVVVRIEEAMSDSSGKVFIEDFWNWHLFESDYPHLTIYKFGYVCWDQGNVYIDEFNAPRRTDFDKRNRTARMKKWPEGFSFIGHEKFVHTVTTSDYSEAPKHLFRNAFHLEIPLASKENTERDEKRKEMNVEKSRREGP